MNDIDRKDLVSVNLKYGTGSKPLKVLAFAQLAVKALFLHGDSLKVSQITLNIAKLIGVKKISDSLVQEGLEHLLEINKVRNNDDTWSLAHGVKDEIMKDLEQSRYYINRVLKAHFPNTLEDKELKNWFKEALVDFFSCYGDEWVAAVSKGVKSASLKTTKNIHELLSSSIKKFKLEQFQETLINGFIKFLSSDDILDQQYLMLISQAMFSARLVAADIGADPITLEELKESKFILDTNILLAISLESHRVASSINSLEEALKLIKTELIYLHSTEEEYERALTGKRGTVLNLVQEFPDDIIKDVRDDFIITAKSRKCTNVEDYERFFDSLVKIPSTLTGGYSIKKEDFSDIETIRKSAEKDLKLKNLIQHYASLRPPWRGLKSEAALNHDATLLLVANFLREKYEKCWILTLDRSLQGCAIDLAGPHGIPIALSVSALIEILAINNAGPELNASNFAPLLSKIILNECIPPVNTYVIHDLQILNTINEQAAKLPSVYIKEMLKEIVKSRITSKSTESTALALKINRMFQKDLGEIRDNFNASQRRVQIAEEEASQGKEKSKKLMKYLISSRINTIKRIALGKLILKLIIGVVITTGIVVILHYLYKTCFKAASRESSINYWLATIPYLLMGWTLIPRSILSYKKECRNAEQIATEEANRVTT